ncbi:phosphopentomutase [Haloferula luteola]|uniref:Phosphopentomutase n=1 Tax=Haloferula luteola TaxID=595692 RepID=A0A840VBB7_9BACT|nr:phosphopentomutase [Haloferula luteola]MBB5351230.1 phosphopentomutase [Haloferula luteola]
MRALCIVLDSVGCGHAPDAADFGDKGANTLGHLRERIPNLAWPHLASLGLDDLLNPPFPSKLQEKNAARLTELSAGKDTTTGHWELMGAQLTEPFATFERFPEDLVAELEQIGGRSFLGNEAASGTEILARLGAEHFRTGQPILYTSADSVLQIAAHEDPHIFGLERLQQWCRDARAVLDRRNCRIGRVIARPFVGDPTNGFQRTSHRHDYSLQPPETVLNRLTAAGVPVHGIGKIHDIFAGSGITHSHPTPSNAAGMATIERLWSERVDGLVFANLVDFDTLYGHRRDPDGYARCLIEFDTWLGTFLPKIEANDLLIITADHGNDPYHAGTDHTREQVPLLTRHAAPIRENPTFSEVARLLEVAFLPPS